MTCSAQGRASRLPLPGTPAPRGGRRQRDHPLSAIRRGTHPERRQIRRAVCSPLHATLLSVSGDYSSFFPNRATAAFFADTTCSSGVIFAARASPLHFTIRQSAIQNDPLPDRSQFPLFAAILRFVVSVSPTE